MLINETACEDTRIEAAHALATGEGKGEEYVSRTVGFMKGVKYIVQQAVGDHPH
jgi:hypothetical protein